MTTNKEASFIAPNATLPETLAASLAIGGGGFATMRLLQELMAQTKPKHEPGENDNSLTIDLPKTMMPNYMQTLQQPVPQQPGLPKHAGDNINKLLAIGGGVPAGFMGAKYLYDKYKEYQLKQELELANKRYMQAMTDFNNPEVSAAQLGQPTPAPAPGMQQVPKLAETTTPGVDALCEKLAEDFNKQADIGGAISGLWSALPFTPNDPQHEALVQGSNSLFREQLFKNLSKAVPGGIGDLVSDAMIIGGTGVGLGTFGAMALANKNRQEAEKKRQFPSSVEINYA